MAARSLWKGTNPGVVQSYQPGLCLFALLSWNIQGGRLTKKRQTYLAHNSACLWLWPLHWFISVQSPKTDGRWKMALACAGKWLGFKPGSREREGGASLSPFITALSSLFSFLFWDRVSCSSGRPSVLCVAEDDLWLLTFQMLGSLI